MNFELILKLNNELSWKIAEIQIKQFSFTRIKNKKFASKADNLENSKTNIPCCMIIVQCCYWLKISITYCSALISPLFAFTHLNFNKKTKIIPIFKKLKVFFNNSLKNHLTESIFSKTFHNNKHSILI